jgi:AmiR/NasT family two-component response regulator
MMDTQEVLDKTAAISMLEWEHDISIAAALDVDMKRVKDWDRLKSEIEEMKQSLNRRTDEDLKKALTMVIDRMTEMEEEDEQNIRCDVFK